MPIDINNDSDRKPDWVVCAAMRHNVTKRIVCGARHYDPIMRAQMETDSFWNWKNCEQGFITQYGEFLTRKQAQDLAIKNGQRRYRCGGDDNKLFSENLY